MVLDDLGKSLKGTIKKIANAVHIDSKLVKEVVRDIQRALLQADVNVKLVLELSKKIEKRALSEKPPAGMSNREHVIRIVYEELVEILGDSRELPIKKQIIMLVGLYGQGKCIHGDSYITLSTGEIIPAEQLYSSYQNSDKKAILKDGELIDITDKKLYVPSFNPNNLKIENKLVTHLWKLEGKELYKVSFDAGNNYDIKVTPEHPFFIMRNGTFMQARADQLDKDDYIALPNNYSTISKIYDLFPDIKKLNLDIYLSSNSIKNSILLKYGTLKNAKNQLLYSRNYCKLTSNINKGKIPIFLIDNSVKIPNNISIKLNKSRKIINFPRYINSDLAEFIGYFIGDGHLTKKGIEIFNKDYEIIKRIIKLSNSIFNIKPKIKKDKRNEVYRITISSTTLAHLFNKIFDFNYGRKGRNLQIPKGVIISSDEIVKKLIRAYIDCDGYISKNYRNLDITSESNLLIKQLNNLLRRFGIFSCISKKLVKNNFYWKLSIESRYAERYCKNIGSILNRKRKRLFRFQDYGKKQGCGKHDMIPLMDTLRNIREAKGHSIGIIQDHSVYSYGTYEKKGIISKEKLEKLYNFYISTPTKPMLDILNNNFQNYSTGLVNATIYRFQEQGIISYNNGIVNLTEEGKKYINQCKNYDIENTIEFLYNLIHSDVCWIRIKKIEVISSPKYVYDLTVEDNHSFIANGVIVHNTTTCGKLATYFKKKGLRPALIAGDVHRPAAYEQLKQISEQVKVPFFGDKKQKNAVKVVKEGLDKFKRSSDVIIVDTSGRHKLEDDLIDEMKQIFKATKPNEKLLVMDAAVGQQAGPQAKAFNDAVNITGIVLTKLDGTAKGGGALSAAAEVGAPIVFIGTGEHSSDFEKFEPAGFISRLLGMGDIKALIEKAEESLKGKDVEKTAKKIMSGKFTLHDMYDQLDMLSGMGRLSKVADMLPGGFPGRGKIKEEDMDKTENKMSKFKIIMDSMTDEEMNDPNIIRSSRIKRIARGAGVENRNVKELLKYYNVMKRTMKSLSGNRKMQKNLMKRLNFGNQ